MSRRRPSEYVGPTKAISLRELERLGPGHAIQPKYDGVYCRLYLNAQGRVSRAFLRSGAECPAYLVSHLMGALVGAPHAHLVGELDAMTDAGEAAAKLGPRKVHLFDCLFDGTRSLVGLPYRDRRDALWRMTAAVQCYAPDDDHRPAPWRRYRDPVLPGWRICPVVDQVPVARAGWAWDAWVKEQDGEGLVAVALDAPVGRACAKLKCKPVEHIDALVTSVSRTTLVCAWRGSLFTVAAGRHMAEAGDVVEVRHDGWYAVGQVPRFARLVRVRRDLQ